MVTYTIARHGEGGYRRYRYPAIGRTTSRDLIVVYEACSQPHPDFDPSSQEVVGAERPVRTQSDPFKMPCPTSLYYVYSTDAGQSWSSPQLWLEGRGPGEDGGAVGYHAPSFIPDRVTGRMFCFYNQSLDAGFRDSLPGAGAAERKIVHNFLAWTDDLGLNWNHQEITAMLDAGRGFTGHLLSTGHGIQLWQGEHAERLLHTSVVLTSDGVSHLVTLGSDDHGTTWWSSQPWGEDVINAQLSELSDGKLLICMQGESAAVYSSATSVDGGRNLQDIQRLGPAEKTEFRTVPTRAFPCAETGSPQAKVIISAVGVGEEGAGGQQLCVSVDDGATFRPIPDCILPAVGTMDINSLPDQAMCLVAYEDIEGLKLELISFEQLGIFYLAKGWNASVAEQVDLLTRLGLEPKSV